MFLNRFPPIQTLQRIDPGAGANVIRATSSKGCAARGGLRGGGHGDVALAPAGSRARAGE